MTDNNHLIVPSPELFKQWEDDILNERDNVDHVLDCAWKDGFRAGADMELEACCEHLKGTMSPKATIDYLRAARRPKPPSLKEQALALLDPSNTYGSISQEEEYRISVANADTIRRALEALPDD